MTVYKSSIINRLQEVSDCKIYKVADDICFSSQHVETYCKVCFLLIIFFIFWFFKYSDDSITGNPSWIFTKSISNWTLA